MFLDAAPGGLPLDVRPATNKTKGLVEIINGILGFWKEAVTATPSTDQGIADAGLFPKGTRKDIGGFIIKTDMAIVDVKIGQSFEAGDFVYAEVATGDPTGVVVAADDPGNYRIGVAKHDYAVSASVGQLEVLDFHGTELIEEAAS